MDVVQRMKKALRRGRSVELPPENRDAFYVLLPYCMQNQHRVIADLLSGSNFNVNYQDGRAMRALLHHAANVGGFETVALLLRRGANVDIQDRNGTTALHLAARNGHRKCIQKLLEANADIRLHDNEGLTALHWLAYNGRTELVVIMLQRGEFVDVEDAHGQTALHVSCRNGHFQTANVLLERNADINKSDRQGRLALNFACHNGQVDCIKLLLKKGVKCVADNNGVSPIELCVINKYHDCAELILRQFPGELDCLVKLACDNKISEEQVIHTLHHLCSNNNQLHGTILGRLAKEASTTGLELLSSSSDYDHWSSQFLRVVHILCALDKVPLSSQEPEQQHWPTSPRRRRWNSFLSSGYRDSTPVSPPADTQSQQQKQHSMDDLSAAFESLRKESPKPGDISSAPFFLLEEVWASLHSWYDLLEQEVQRLPEATGNTVGPANDVTTEEYDGVIPEVTVETSTNDTVPTASLATLRSISLDSSEGGPDIAAAIVHGAPASRRRAFLRGLPQRAYSLEELVPGDLNRSRKRRSLNLDNVNATPSPGADFLSLPSQMSEGVATGGDQSQQQQEVGVAYGADQLLSCNSPIEEGNEDAHESTPPTNHVQPSSLMLDAATPSLDVLTPSSVAAASSTNASEMGELLLAARSEFASDFANRLCAVTHGYALCCTTLHRKSGAGAVEVYPPFEDFIDKYEKVLKVLLARNPLLIFEHFHFLLEYPSLMKRFMHIVREQPFDLRKKWFYENLYKDKKPHNDISMLDEAQVMMVSRGNIFSSSCSKIMEANPDNLKENLSVRFLGEAGVGMGVLKEWFDQLSAEVLNPNYALFIQSADGATFQPNSNSDVNPDHLSYFLFSGRMMALAIYHQHLLNVYFTRSFYKHILGIPVSYKDVESIDPDFAKSLQWTLDNKIDDLGLDLTFALETDVFGTAAERELLEGGKNIAVSDNNKYQYVQLVAEMKLTAAIEAQIQHFLDGFYSIVPHSLIALFNEYELELLMSGLPEIDPDDWQANTEYSGDGYTEDHPVIKWFWELVHEYSEKDRALLLQFVTGSSRVPMGGFCNLMGAGGLQKFTITREPNPDHLPSAGTCFNLLKLPEYTSKKIIAEKLNIAIHFGSQRFDFA